MRSAAEGKQWYYWIKRNVFFRNTPLLSLFGQCHFCFGEHFKQKDASGVEMWDMPNQRENRRTYFNWEEHKCKKCGQNWIYNRITFEKPEYKHLD